MFYNYYRDHKFKICEVLLATIKLFERIGYWRPAHFDRTWCTKIVYHIWTLTWWSWYLGLLMIVQGVACFVYWPNISQVSGAAFIFLSNLVHTLKLGNLIYRRDLIKTHLRYFQTTNATENHNDPEIVEIIQKYERNSFRDVAVYSFFSSFTCSGWAVIGDTSGDPWGFPLVAWYPFQTNYTPIYQLTYLHQIVAVLTAALLCVAIDTISTNFCVQICCQFDLLRKHLRDTDKIVGLTIQSYTLPDEIVFPKLSKVVARHCELLKICGEINLTIGWTVFVQFGVSSLIICMTLYQFVAIPDQNKLTLIGLFGYMISMTIQVFLYCYYGSQIIELSENIAVEATSVTWYLFSIKSRRALLQLLQKAQQPVIIRAGGLVPLSIETFASIMKTSYSFFSVVQNLK